MSCLKICNLTVQINNKTICHQFNAVFKAGDMCAILGPNGVGKTTLLHAIAGLHPMMNGTIFLNDTAITKLSAKDRAKQLGILFQEHNHQFAPTLLEYCLTSRYPHSSHFKNDLHLVKLALEKVNLLSCAEKKITELSGGERRRLAIAALLTQDPDVFLLDEPSNHLDSYHQILLMQTLKSLAQEKDKILLLSTHDINLAAKYCEKVLLFYPHGELLFGATMDLLTEFNLSNLYNHPIQKSMVWVA